MKDETDKRYGKLIVLALDDKRSPCGQILWRCRCDCGEETVVRGISLRNGDTKSCGCFRREYLVLPAGEGVKNKLWRQYKQSARKRGYVWALSKSDFLQITQANCEYCGASPSNRCHGLVDTFVYTGIDRRDNTQGYVLGNIVPCCVVCNVAKASMSLEAFKEWVKRVYEKIVAGL